MKPANHLVSTAFREDFAQAKLEELEFPTSLDASRRVLKAVEDPDIGLQGGHRIRVGERVKELVIAKDLGYFVQNAVA